MACPSLNARAIAVDPRSPDIVYAANISSYGNEGYGIYKSIDGGGALGTSLSLTPLYVEELMNYLSVIQLPMRF